MTAKEKAIELIDRYSELGIGHPTSLLLAKQCALIAVDEILNTNTLQDRSCGFIPLCEKHTKYWQEVKKELQNV